MSEVRIGQVWADNDRRCEGRTISIDGDKAICAVAWPGHKTRKRTTLSLRRFKPTSTGYRLISQAVVPA